MRGRSALTERRGIMIEDGRCKGEQSGVERSDSPLQHLRINPSAYEICILRCIFRCLGLHWKGLRVSIILQKIQPPNVECRMSNVDDQRSNVGMPLAV